MKPSKNAVAGAYSVETKHSIATIRLRLRGRPKARYQNGKLKFHYQPKFELNSGKFIGVEALANGWYHPTDGILAPVAFYRILN